MEPSKDYVPPPKAYEVMTWPEFQALLARLGVDLGRHTNYLRLTFDCRESMPVQVEHDFMAEDAQLGDGR